MTTSGWLLCGAYTVKVGHNQCPTLGTGLRAVRVRSVGGKNGIAMAADTDFRIEDGAAVGAPLAPRTESDPNPAFVCCDATRRRVFVAVEDYGPEGGFVAAYAFDPATGALSFVARQPAGGAATCYLSVHPSGRFVLAANYMGGNIAVLPIIEGSQVNTKHGVIRTDHQPHDVPEQPFLVQSPHRVAQRVPVGPVRDP